MQESFIMLPADEQEPPLQNRELDVGAYQFTWERGRPLLECCDLSPPDKSVKCLLYQACCLREIGGCQSVVNGFADQFMLRIPCAGSLMELSDSIWLHALQTLAQHLCEQLVIAVPPPLIVQGEQKEIGLFQPLK